MNFSELLTKLKQIPTLNFTIIDGAQVIIMSLILYYLIRTLYKTRAWILVKGMLIIGLAYLAVYLMDMTVLSTIMQSLFSTMIIAIIIMMQPELQRIVEMIGTKKLTNLRSLFGKKNKSVEWQSKQTISSIASACEIMSPAKTGALIVIERAIPLSEYAQSGIQLNSDISRQLLLQIFEKNTPLHDGAVIISNNKIVSATSYLPLSDNATIDKNFGTRHRAAIGVSEVTDCIAIVVSEETGAISVCVAGKIVHDISATELERMLKEYVRESEQTHKERKFKTPLYLKILAPILSVCIWAGIIMETDPMTTKIYTDIPIQIVNESSLDMSGQSYIAVDEQTVSVLVKARRSVIASLDKESISAIADISNMSIVNAVPIDIAVDTQYTVESTEIVFGNNVLKLTLEDLAQAEIPITHQIIGNDNPSYLAILKELDTATLSVTCPQSIAKTIDKAMIVIDATEKTNDFVISAVPVIYDKNGNVISGEKIKLSKEKIRAQVSVIEISEHPLSVELTEQTIGNDRYFVLHDYSLEMDSIRVAVDTSVFAGTPEFKIIIDPTSLEDDANSVLINLQSILPDGIHLANDQNSQITVGLNLTAYNKQAIPMSVGDIAVPATGSSYITIGVVEAPTAITLYISDKIDEIQHLTISDLKPTFKIESLNAGTYVASLTFTDIEGVEIFGNPVVKYSVTRKGGK